MNTNIAQADHEGFDHEGFDRKGYNREGYDRKGFYLDGNFEGYNSFDRPQARPTGANEGYDWMSWPYQLDR